MVSLFSSLSYEYYFYYFQDVNMDVHLISKIFQKPPADIGQGILERNMLRDLLLLYSLSVFNKTS